VSQAISYTQGPVGRQLYRLAMPGVWGLAATLSFNAVDAFFVGMLGSDSLAAMSFTFPVSLLVTTIAVGFATGASSVYARLLGNNMAIPARRIAADTLIMSVVVSLIVMVTGLWLMQPTFVMLGAGPELMPLIEAYMWPWYWNAPFFACSAVISAIMQASGHTRIAGAMMIGSAIINIILDPILIFGLGPIPRMEIAGAAWTTVISRVLLVIAGAYFVWRYKLVSMPHLQLGPLLRSWKAVMHVGLPSIATGVVVPVAASIVLALVAGYGPDAVAALGVVQRLDPMLLIAFFALSGVVGPFFGQNMTDELRPRQREAVRLLFRFSMIFSALCALVLWLAGPAIGSLFSTSPEVIRIVALYFAVMPISYGFIGVSIVATSAFNGMGKPLPGMVLSMLRIIGFNVPFALAGQWLGGLTGLFIGVAFANIAAGVLSQWWISREVRSAAPDNG
jgi:putative MATE family efflux protein